MDEDDDKFNDPVGLAWPLRPLLGDHLERLEERWHDQPRTPGLATGLEELDDVLGGLEPSTVTVLAGRPGSGKTALALAIAAHVGIQQEKGVLYVSLQHPYHQMVERLVVREVGADPCQYRRGRLEDPQWTVLGRVLGRHSRSTLFVDDSPSLTIDEVRCRASWMGKRHGLALVVIDFLQLLVDYRPGGGQRADELDRALRVLRVLAREEEVPVVVLAQAKPEPTPGDQGGLRCVRGCPTGEDFDTVLLLGVPDAAAGQLEVRCLKHREATGVTMHLDLSKRTTT